MSGLAAAAVAMASITYFVGALHLFVYAHRPRRRYSLYFALLCLFYGSYDAISAALYLSEEPTDILLYLRYMVLALSVGGIFFTWFVSDFSGGGLRRPALGISLAFLPPLLAAAFDVRALLFSGDPAFTTIHLPFGLSLRQHVVPEGPILIYMALPLYASILLGLRGGHLLKKRGDARRGNFLLAASAIFLLGVLSDSAVLFGIYDFLFLAKFSFVTFVLLMTYSLLREALAAEEIRTALEESEERFMLALDGANEGLWDWSPGTEEVHFSPRWFTMLGYEPDELPHSFETWVSLLHPDDRERSVTFAKNFIESGDEFFSLEFRLRTKSGGWRWILSRGKAVIRDENGRVVRMVGTHSDITPRKRAEEDLAASEERFRSIVKASPMGIYVCQLDGGGRLILTDGNAAADRLTGVASAEIAGKPLEEVFPALADTEIPAILRRTAAEGVPWESRDLAYRDGRVDGIFDVHAFRTSPGRVTIMFLDVTDRHRAAETLRKSEAMYRSYFSLGLIGMAVLSPNARWLEVNGRLCEILGYPAEELSRKCWGDLTHPEDAAAVHEQFAMLVAGEIDDFAGEMRFLRGDGSVVFVEHSLTCVRREDGSVEFLIAHIQDVTERRQTEEQLRHSQKMEAVGQLAGGVAHDFNNILQAIRGYTDVSLTQVGTGHPARGNLVEVRKAADRAARLTRQLLTFSRRDALKPAWLNLNDVIADLLKMLRRVIGEQVELIVSSSPKLLPVRVDPGQMEQVILNLCINARDAMKNGGRLVIETENFTADGDFVKERPWAHEGDYVRIRFTDCGEGIPEEIRDRIFEPFFTTKEVGQGTGLGLATVYAILERHGGGIEVKSLLGEGTIVTAYLPASRMPEEEPPPFEPEPAPPGGTETVLLAEDDEAVRRLVVSLLGDVGYQVLVAKDGQEAIRVFERRSAEIDLALVDVIMPKRSGRDVYTAVKRIRPSVPVLFMSGYSFSALERGHLPDGSAPLLRKPYTPEDLLRKVRQALDSAKKPA